MTNVTSDMTITANFSISVDSTLALNISCVQYQGGRYGFILKYSPVAGDPSALDWKMDTSTVNEVNNSGSGCISVGTDLKISIPSITYQKKRYAFTMNYLPVPSDPLGLYWKMDSNTIKSLSD